MSVDGSALYQQPNERCGMSSYGDDDELSVEVGETQYAFPVTSELVHSSPSMDGFSLVSKARPML